MTRRIFTFYAVLFALAVSLTMGGESIAAEQRQQSVAPPEQRWSWVNPLDQTMYTMQRFDDEVTVALRHHDVLTDTTRGEYVSVMEFRFQLTGGMVGDITVNPSELPGLVFEMWKARKLRCILTRTVPDLFGNTANLCQLAPFSIRINSGTYSLMKGGVVWIITSSVTSTQAPATGSGLPTWGR